MNIKVGDEVVHPSCPGWWFTVINISANTNRAAVCFGCSGPYAGSFPAAELLPFKQVHGDREERVVRYI